ncbi:MAG: hypothetical protein KDD47_14180 [Acidobacteria bacterium]|nr:hypothetical protein [Acidobacteriota bacterium]
MTSDWSAGGPAVSELAADNGCFDFLNWRCDLLGEISPGGLLSELQARGFELRTSHPSLKVLRDASGNEISWVCSTGRVRLRVDYLLPRERREEEARRLHGVFVAALRAV